MTYGFAFHVLQTELHEATVEMFMQLFRASRNVAVYSPAVHSSAVYSAVQPWLPVVVVHCHI